MPLSGQQLTDASEVHAIAVKRLENLARAEIDRSYSRLVSKASLKGMATVFRTLGELSEKIVGKYGKLAIRESKRYTSEAYGLVGEPAAEDLAAPVQDAQAMISEFTRHTQAILSIRTTRMLQSGMDPEAVSAWMQGDFRKAERVFGAYKAGLKMAVAGAVQGLAQVQSVSAFRPARETIGADTT